MSRFKFFLTSSNHSDKATNQTAATTTTSKKNTTPIINPPSSYVNTSTTNSEITSNDVIDQPKKEYDEPSDKSILIINHNDTSNNSKILTSISGAHINDIDTKFIQSKDYVENSYYNNTSDASSNTQPPPPTHINTPTETWNENRKFGNLKQLLIDSKCKKQTTPSKEQRLKLFQVELDRLTDENVKLREELTYYKDENERLKTAMKDLRQNEIKKQLNRRLQNVTIESKPGQVEIISSGIKHYSKSDNDKQFIKNVLKKNEFFAQLDKNQVKELVDCCHLFPILNGEFLYKEGESGDCLFIIEQGKFQIEKDDKVLGEITNGSVTGEASVLYRCLRTASCRGASDDCKVWCLKQDSFQNIMLKSHYKLKNEYIELLRNVPILSQLSESSLLSVINIVQELKFNKGEYIYRKGEIGKVFFIVKTGSVLLYKKPNKNSERPILFKQLGRGSYFGEKALLNEERRAFDAISGENGCVVLAIESDDFSILINEQDELQEVENLGSTGPHHRHSSTYTASTTITTPNELSKSMDTTRSGVRNISHRRIASSQSGVYGIEISKIKIDDLCIIMTRNIDVYSRLDLVALKNDRKQMFMLKQIKKRTVHDANIQDKIIYEKKILLQSDCPFIIKLHRTYKDRKYVYMLYEPCLGGDMLSLLNTTGRLDDHSSRFYAACVIEAFNYLHKNNIIFRNFKTDNTYIDSTGYIKLAELTNAKKLGAGSRAWTFTGEPEYIAPEIILNKGYDFSVDYWSLGIFIYEMLMGNTPFRGDDAMKIYNLALKGLDNFVFPSYVNRVAALIIKKLCKVNPHERLGHQKGGWNDVRKHKWFEGFDWIKLSRRELPPPHHPNILNDIESLEDAPYLKDDEIPPDDNTGWDKDF